MPAWSSVHCLGCQPKLHESNAYEILYERKAQTRTFSSTASLILFNTQTIHPRSITSAINPNSHFSASPSLFAALTSKLEAAAEALAREAKKNSKNHLVTNNNLRLSFSVIFGRSDLMSFKRAERNADKGMH